MDLKIELTNTALQAFQETIMKTIEEKLKQHDISLNDDCHFFHHKDGTTELKYNDETLLKFTDPYIKSEEDSLTFIFKVHKDKERKQDGK